MRVIAFGCVHEGASSERTERFLRQVISERPDAVVFLGDGISGLERHSPAWREIKERFVYWEIRGECDPYGAPYCVLDGVRYEHGNRIDEAAVTTSKVRNFFRGHRVVHAHTHVPRSPLSGWAIDAGSLSINGTFVEVDDGRPILRTAGERRVTCVS